MSMVTAALSLAPTIAGAATQLMSGFSQSREAGYNASIYEQRASAIDVQKSIEARQYERAKRQVAGTTTARVAKGGLMLSGSPMAVMVDSLTQLEMDKEIGQYNLEVEKRFSLSGAQAYRRQARTYETQGYANAFSTLLRGGFDTAINSGLLRFNNTNTIFGGRGGTNTGMQMGPYGRPTTTWSPYR